MLTSDLADELAGRLGGRVDGLHRLSGGASRETWEFTHVAGGDGQGRRLILRRDPPGSRAHHMDREVALLSAAGAAGVPVPTVVDADASSIVMEHVAGETIPRKILRDEQFASVRPLLAAQCGAVLARIHSIDPAHVKGLDPTDQLDQWRSVLDGLGQPRPAFELGFRWLLQNPVPRRTDTVVHGDFRNGNLIVDARGIAAVLDWELAHLGDPHEDLAWLCVKAWRFGSRLPAGGFGTYDELCSAYERAGGATVDREALRWWQILGTLKWGIICMLQSSAHLSGANRSVELASLGRRVCENEWDVLELLP